MSMSSINWPSIAWAPNSHGNSPFEINNALSSNIVHNFDKSFLTVPNILYNETSNSGLPFEKDHLRSSSEQYMRFSGANSRGKSRGRSTLFHWNSLDENSNNKPPGRTTDDGVVLLVSLFNLLAVVVYAGHQLLTGEISDIDKRVVLWQVQKVLDELVLKVHSSDTASNLLSRAFKIGDGNTSGRDMNHDSLSSNIFQIFNEKNPQILEETLNKIKHNIQKEILTLPTNLRGPKIDPKIFRPLSTLYTKITKPNKKGRAFSSTVLQEVSSVMKTAHKMSYEDIQRVLEAISRLGRVQKRYDVVSLLKSLISTKVEKNYGSETIFTSAENGSTRARRETQHRRRSSIGRMFRDNRGFSGYSKAAMLYKARRIKEISEAKKANLKSMRESREKKEKLIKRKGIVRHVLQEDLVTSWADGWFTLLTQASPVALHISTLYTRSWEQPQCSRAFLCKANTYWRKRGTFQATLAPFLSVLASWGLEDKMHHSLGDALIAVRAGWMDKDCKRLFPDCIQHDDPHPLVKEAFTLFNRKKENTNLKILSSTFSSKTGSPNQTKEFPLSEKSHLKVTLQSSPTTTPTEPPTPPSPTTPPPPPQHITRPPQTRPYSPSDDIHHQAKPYNRYDQPFSNDQITLPSGSITGMALQDRPVEKMNMMHDSDVQSTNYGAVPATIHNLLNVWNGNRDALEQQVNPLNNEITSHLAGPQNQEPHYDDRRHFGPVDKWQSQDGPPFLHQPGYSSYMANQKPNFIRQGHRSIPNIKRISQPTFYLPSRNVTKETKQSKYMYGLRRGLPSQNVNSHIPLFETSMNYQSQSPFSQKLRANKVYKQRTTSPKRTGHLRGYKRFLYTSQTPVTTTERVAQPLNGKHISQFTHKDAITDQLRNDLLYQYVRDSRRATTE